MKLGLYLDMRNPPYWPAPWADLYRELTVDELRREFRTTGAARGFKVLDAGQARAELAAITAGLPVEHLLFWCRIGGMPDSLVAEHLDLLVGEVRTGLHARQPG
jgi:hypothetical protein